MSDVGGEPRRPGALHGSRRSDVNAMRQTAAVPTPEDAAAIVAALIAGGYADEVVTGGAGSAAQSGTSRWRLAARDYGGRTERSTDLRTPAWRNS